jgi:hypothetical protein
MPGLLDVGREGVEVLLDGDEVGILVSKITGVCQLAVAFGELPDEGLGQIAGTVMRADAASELGGEVDWECESHLAGGHTSIVPYIGKYWPRRDTDER